MKASMGTMAFLAARRRGFAFSQTPVNLRKFQDWPIQGLGPTGIPVASPSGYSYLGSTRVQNYAIDVKPYTQQLHPQLGFTPLWGYGQNNNHRHLGGVIVVQKNQPIMLRVNNLLTGATHPVASYIDRSARFPDAAAYPDTRISVHLHGGFIPWTSDGNPDSWFGPAGGWAGHQYCSGPATLLGNQTSPQQNSLGYQDYYWPNQQSARMLWYHDHAHDNTRVSAYGGLATAYIIRDDLENLLIRMGVLTTREVPLVFQDKVFNSDGSLWYPSIYEPDTLPTGRWAVDPAPPVPLLPMPVPSCVPEFYGDTILCNGTAYPFVPVEPRRYRFRILNAFQAKFMNINFVVLPSGVTEVPVVPIPAPAVGQPDYRLRDPLTGAVVPYDIPDPTLSALKIIQIGTEGGFLKAPVILNGNGLVNPVGFDQITQNVIRYNLVLGPAERADILVDFSSVPGQKVVMYTDAPSPFPGGDPRNDYYWGQANLTAIGGSAGPTAAGLGPDTRSMLQFQVASTGTGTDMAEATMLSTLTTQLARVFTTLNPLAATGTTELTLNEQFDEFGRLTQKLGTVIPGLLNQPNPLYYNDLLTADEVYPRGTIRKWRIWNTTGDTHPIHFHLVNVQILSRELFDGITPDPSRITGVSPVADPSALPGVDKNELGWKETVRINPLEVVTLIMKFDLPAVPFTTPLSHGHPIATGHEYVWHCHILEHEEHDMMRSFIVT